MPEKPTSKTTNFLGYGLLTGDNGVYGVDRHFDESLSDFDASDIGDTIIARRTRNSRIAFAQPPAQMSHPAYGELYDTLRTRDGWDRLIDYMFSGTILPSTTTQVSAVLTAATDQEQPINLRQGLYPGGVQAYPCVRLFSFASTAGTATGALQFFYIDPSGQRFPLGCFLAPNGQGNLLPNLVATDPITDNNPPNLGSLQVIMVSGGTPVTLAYEMGISIVYLRPATSAIPVDSVKRHKPVSHP